MLSSLEAALVFAVLIVPGLLLISGYNRTRAHSLPRRDLYVLAQAVVVSLAWLPALWLLGGRKMVDWADAEALSDHDGALIFVVLLNLAIPLAVGLVAGRLLDWIGDYTWLARYIGWTGIFQPPTAWEAMWLPLSHADWAAVQIILKGGETFNVLFDDGSTVGLAPGPRYLFFDTEYHLEDDELEVEQHEGIFIDGTEVVSVRIEHVVLEESSTE